METTTYKKIVVFDVNLDWNCYKQEDRRYKDLPLVYSLMKEASKYQTIVIQTSGCLVDALDYANEHEIKTGYIVASGGSIIYDLANNKIVQMLPLSQDDVQAVVHHGIMHNINITFYTPERKFIYVSNTVGYQSLRNMCYSHHELIESYDLLQKTLNRTDIVDIGYLMFLGPLDHPKQRLVLYNLNKFWDDEICNLSFKTNNTSKFVHIGDKNATKIKAVEKIMELNGVDHLSDVLYVAASCINNECFVSFKNSIVASNSDFFNEIGANANPKYIADQVYNLDPEFGLHTNSFWK